MCKKNIIKINKNNNINKDSLNDQLNNLQINDEINVNEGKLNFENEKINDESIETIPLNEEKSMTNMSFRDDFKELLNKNSTWPCDCGILDNSLGKIICKGCSKYRPLETYSNLVFNPLLAEKSEIKEFNMRRKHEEKVFQSLKDRNMDNLKHAYFFAIDITWYNKWQSFIYNDDKEKGLK